MRAIGEVLIIATLTPLLQSECADMFLNFPLNTCSYAYDCCCYHHCHYFSWRIIPRGSRWLPRNCLEMPFWELGSVPFESNTGRCGYAREIKKKKTLAQIDHIYFVYHFPPELLTQGLDHSRCSINEWSDKVLFSLRGTPSLVENTDVCTIN